MTTNTPADDQYALIIGAMKSGTSALFDLLCQHPQVCAAKVKEPEFFTEHQGHGLQVDRYEELWDFVPETHRVALEASTGYTKFPQETGVAERIAERGLRPKFIYVLRDPVERVKSHVAYSAWGQRGGTVDFLAPNVVATSKYAMQLDQFTPVFPREQILLVDHADLQGDPKRVTSSIFEFLDLDPCDVQPLTSAKNAARPRSGWERRIMRSGRLAQVAAAAPPSVKAAFRRLSAVGTSGGRPTMDSETEQSLRALLVDDMARLRSEWDVDVSRWGF